MRVFTRKVPPVDASEDQRRMLMQLPEYQGEILHFIDIYLFDNGSITMLMRVLWEEMKEQPFLFLSLDLPAAPLYRDELMQNIIPQVTISFNRYTIFTLSFLKNYMTKQCAKIKNMIDNLFLGSVARSSAKVQRFNWERVQDIQWELP